MISGHDLVYIVHGSNAHTWWRRAANRGYPWWRRWSLFSNSIREALGEACELREFVWSGSNTHQARLTAGTELATLIEKTTGRRIHLVGHSHGGNVALAAATQLAAGTIETIVLLANPHMVAGEQWLYWGDAASRAGRIWNLYSPQDKVQSTLARVFHGKTSTRESPLSVHRTYRGPGHESVHDRAVHWKGALSAHRAMHSAAMGTVVGVLLRGRTFFEAMDTAHLDPKAPNEVRDRGGWGGIAVSQEMIRGRSDPSPFDLKSSSASDVGVLFIHGFTASPSEMRPMAEFIHERTGWRCKSILLPGHGTRVQDMEHTRGTAWVTAVDEAYAELARGCRRVFLAGVSLGAVLCCHVGMKHHDEAELGGLILLAPAFGVSRKRTVAVSLLRGVMPLRSKGVRAAHYFLEKKLFSYIETPLNRAAEVIRLGRQAWKNLYKLKNVPVLMFAGDLDTTVSLSLIREAARRNPAVRLVWLPCSRHILTVEPDAEEAFRASVEFMRQNSL